MKHPGQPARKPSGALSSTFSGEPASGLPSQPAHGRHRILQPVWVRISHWLNALAAVLMLMSGWRIYDASPIFAGFVIPKAITLGGWLGGALQWHFAAMWLLFFNGLFYLAMNIVTGRIKSKFFPLSPKAILHDLGEALRGHLSHADPSKYNAVQKFAYLFAMLDITVLVLSGLAIWKSVQLPVLREVMGGYDSARVVHFSAMSLLVAFVVVHVVMVALVPRSLLTMIRGR
jgi:thiosulfate reductase cytochrome b subunit